MVVISIFNHHSPSYESDAYYAVCCRN